MEAAVIVTYRCPSACQRCHTWQNPTAVHEEFSPALLEKLPALSFCNVTGGEPLVRHDLPEIIDILLARSRRVVVSTSGYFTDQTMQLAERFPRLGIRVSLEGLPAASDRLRGMKDSFDHGLRTLLELTKRRHRDVGFSVTISEENARDVPHLYRLARGMGWEFATAAVHNSDYFHKTDNRITNREVVVAALNELMCELLRSWRVKDWFRAYFNHGIVNYVQGRPRLLPCAAGSGVFFLDPRGEILPCNGMERSLWYQSFGNLHDADFHTIWNSQRAATIRKTVSTCPKNCWMIGTVSPLLRANPLVAARWIVGAQARRLRGRQP
ncbi:MAG: radical SAM protein [Thermoanaerobaculaceae bacterium]|nr:radical SAM protein [Thermoanaerobaculaceae bacterium]